MNLRIVLALFAISNAQLYQYLPFKQLQQIINFPTYTPDERVSLATQAKQILSIYVNRQSKVDSYNYDPIPVIDNLISESAKLTDITFHTKMSNLFRSLRDMQAVFPFIFTLGHTSNPILSPLVIVQGFAADEVLSVIPQNVKSIVSTGDILVSINGKTFQQLLREYNAGGANEFGAQRTMLNYLSLRSGLGFLLPNETEVTYVLRRKNDVLYKTYSITVPIGFLAMKRFNFLLVGSVFKFCDLTVPSISQTSTTESSLTFQPTATTTLLQSIEPSPSSVMVRSRRQNQKKIEKNILNTHFKLTKELKAQMNLAIDSPFQEVMASFDLYKDYIPRSTQEQSISFVVYNSTQGTRLGVIRLQDFNPSRGIDMSIRLIHGLLTNELVNTDALVFDVRNNPGGKVPFGDAIALLISRSALPTSARALVTDNNNKLFSGPLSTTEWGKIYQQSKPGDKYSPLTNLETPSKDVDYGQAYFKPVGVFTNANCYSSCDMFAATMQDSGAAVIYGEDPTTGAGGANVVDQNDFLSKTLPSVYSKLPGGQNMRISWRQVVRTGKNKGKLIEDVGVLSDKVFRPIQADFNVDSKISSQFDRIADDLVRIGKADGRADLFFRAIPAIDMDLEVGSFPSFSCNSSSIASLVLVNRETGKNEATVTVGGGKTLTTTNLISNSTSASPTSIAYNIKGYSSAGKILVDVYRFIRFVPKPIDFLTIDKKTIFDPTNAPYSAIYNKGIQNSSEGWNMQANQMVIGNGKGYANTLETTLSFFVNIPTSTPVNGCVNPVAYWGNNLLDITFSYLSVYFMDSEIETTAIFNNQAYPNVYFDLAREWLAITLNSMSTAFIPTEFQPLVDATEGILRLNLDIRDSMTRESMYTISETPYLVQSLLDSLRRFNLGVSDDASMPNNCVTALKKPSFFVDVEYETESDCDFVKIVGAVNGQGVDLWQGSGSGRVAQSFSLENFAGSGGVEVKVVFSSDSDVGGGRVAVKNIEFST